MLPQQPLESKRGHEIASISITIKYPTPIHHQLENLKKMTVQVKVTLGGEKNNRKGETNPEEIR